MGQEPGGRTEVAVAQNMVGTSEVVRSALVRVAADGSGQRQVLWRGEGLAIPTSWSADGHRLAFSRRHPDRGWDVWILDLAVDGGAVAAPLLATKADETRSVFSPDDRFLAYESDVTGQHEIYLRLLEDGSRWPISIGGGSHPLWREERELSFRRGETIFSVRFDAQQPYRFEAVRSIARSPDIQGYNLAWIDGDPWILEATTEPSAPGLTFIVHFESELLSRFGKPVADDRARPTHP